MDIKLLKVGSSSFPKLFIGCQPRISFFIYLSFAVVYLLSRAQLFCYPMDCSLSGSSVHGISQARILEWVAISSSQGSSWPRDQSFISYISGGFFTTEPPSKKNMFCKLSNIRHYGSYHMALTVQFRVLIFKMLYFSLILLTQINDI